MKSESAHRKLFTLRDLIFVRALEIAEDMEAAERNIQHLCQVSHVAVHGQGSHAAVHSVTQQFYRRGRSNYTPDNCHFKDAICHACKKKGHLANICRSKGQFQDRQRTDGETTKKQHRRKYAKAKWILAESERVLEPVIQNCPCTR